MSLKTLFQRERSESTTFEYIQMNALLNPFDIAVEFNSNSTTYQKMFSDLVNLTTLLFDYGIRSEDRVVVASDDPYFHWLILLALENVGAVSCSMLKRKQHFINEFDRYFDFFVDLDDLKVINLAKCQIVALQKEGLIARLNASSHLFSEQFYKIYAPIDLDKPQRIRRSSGTSGGQKMMLSTRAIEEVSMKQYADIMGFSKKTRYLVTNNFVVGSVFQCANLCLRLGATVVMSAELSYRVLLDKGITHFRVFQHKLLELLTTIPQENQPIKHLTLILGAAPISSNLWAQLENSLTNNIIYTYNANEVASICVMRPDGVGVLRPGVVMKILDKNGFNVECGSSGQIVVKTKAQVSGYLNNQDATKKFFKNGWFFTGDEGQWLPDGRLKLLGRIDDVVNIQGSKVWLHEMEIQINLIDDVKDSCVGHRVDENGFSRLVIFLVLKNKENKMQIQEKIKQLFPKVFLEQLIIVETNVILKTDTGKIQRSAMMSNLRDYLKQ